jgi:spore germination cell wall hydrolase CwlJ-like protein
MTRKPTDVLLRSDRVLGVAFAVILAAGSAIVGAAAASRPHTDKVAAAPALRPAVAEIVAPAPVAAVAPAPASAQKAPAAASNDLVLTQLLAEHRCLSEVMYYEARGEGTNGEMAIAEVVFHRLRHGKYGHSICAVVYEGAGSPGCQFSFTCNGELAQRKSYASWRASETLAARILTGEIALGDTTGQATHFHAISVQPDWADDMERTVQIGNHVFYKRGRPHTL